MRLMPIIAMVAAGPVLADAPRIVAVDVASDGGRFTLSVTMEHHDTGWDHFADGVQVELPDGTDLTYRALSHPHLDSDRIEATIAGVSVPQGVDHVVLLTRCSLVGWSAEPYSVKLPGR